MQVDLRTRRQKAAGALYIRVECRDVDAGQIAQCAPDDCGAHVATPDEKELKRPCHDMSIVEDDSKKMYTISYVWDTSVE